MGYPCFIKPSNSGSSIGINKAHNREELIKFLLTACEYDDKVLIEEFINARELECSVLGNKKVVASSVGEIVPSKEFYDYEAKYFSNSKTYIPANIDDEIKERVRQLAIEFYKAIDAKGMSRVDFFLSKDTGEVLINEINTIPGFTSISMYPKLWDYSGIKYDELIDKLIELAMKVE